eukprot:scaffold1208_cov163-Ochromonas_danica.AAC.19
MGGTIAVFTRPAVNNKATIRTMHTQNGEQQHQHPPHHNLASALSATTISRDFQSVHGHPSALAPPLSSIATTTGITSPGGYGFDSGSGTASPTTMLDRVPSLPVSPALQCPQDTTPREDSSFKNAIPYTPKGEEADIFRIAMAESPDTDTSCELEHGSSDLTVLSPRTTTANDVVSQLNATPMLQVTRDCEAKDSDPPTSASAKSCALDELVSGRRYQRGDDSDDTQRLAGFTSTPHAKRKTSSSSCDEDSVPSLLADGKGSNDDLLSDNLSDVDDELEETAAESTSMIFAQLVCAGCSQHHRLAEQVVGDIFQRALLPREVLSQQ